MVRWLTRKARKGSLCVFESWRDFFHEKPPRRKDEGVNFSEPNKPWTLDYSRQNHPPQRMESMSWLVFVIIVAVVFFLFSRGGC
jgi:hypothetical protein